MDELRVLTIVEGEVPGMGFGIQPLGMVGPGAAPMDRLLDSQAGPLCIGDPGSLFAPTWAWPTFRCGQT